MLNNGKDMERGSSASHNLLDHLLSPSWLARTNPKDVARVESKTVIVTPSQRDTVPLPTSGAPGQLGNWMSPAEFQRAVDERFPGCMQGEWLGTWKQHHEWTGR